MGITFGWILLGLVVRPFADLPNVLSLTNNWLYYGLTLAASAVCLTGAGNRRQRIGWALIFLGCLAWNCGSLYFIRLPIDVSGLTLWDDLGFGLFYPLVAAGILLLRDRTESVSRSRPGRWGHVIQLTDGATVAFALNALAAAMVYDHIGQSIQSDPRGTLVNLVYPVFCSVLLTVLVVVLAVHGWAGPPHWWWLAAAILTFWVSDTAFFSAAAEGTYMVGVVTDFGWLAAFACFGSAAAAQLSGPGRRSAGRWRQVLVPSLFAMMAFAILVVTVFQGLNAVANILAAGAMAAVLIRQVLTLIDHEEIFKAVHEESRTDALTGLANRRALLDDLQRRCAFADSEPFAAALFDLDGFKGFNDAFGHPAGDALLARRGQALRDTPGIDRAYRLGGDEYCVIVPAGPGDDWRLVLDACADALGEEAATYRIVSSHGHALVPAEVETPSDVMQLADRRMYANKAEHRSRALPAAR